MNIEMMRLRAQVFLVESALAMVTRVLVDALPEIESALRGSADLARSQLLLAHPRGMSAEEGDLKMAEYQEAWTRLMLRLLPPDTATASDD